MQRNPLALQGVPALSHHLSDLLVKRIRKADVGHDALLKECKWPNALGAIDDLVGHDEISRFYLLAQRTDGAESDNAAHADRAQRGDVSAVGNLVRCDFMAEAVARDEGDWNLVVLEDGDGA